jgi:hypothetical protein
MSSNTCVTLVQSSLCQQIFHQSNDIIRTPQSQVTPLFLQAHAVLNTGRGKQVRSYLVLEMLRQVAPGHLWMKVITYLYPASRKQDRFWHQSCKDHVCGLNQMGRTCLRDCLGLDSLFASATAFLLGFLVPSGLVWTAVRLFLRSFVLRLSNDSSFHQLPSLRISKLLMSTS